MQTWQMPVPAASVLVQTWDQDCQEELILLKNLWDGVTLVRWPKGPGVCLCLCVYTHLNMVPE